MEKTNFESWNSLNDASDAAFHAALKERQLDGSTCLICQCGLEANGLICLGCESEYYWSKGPLGEGFYLDTKVKTLKIFEDVRLELIKKYEKYTGLPTLEYDEIIKGIVADVIIIEKQMLTTCDCCGGEIIPPSIIELHYVPENGLCAGELDDCFIE